MSDELKHLRCENTGLAKEVGRLEKIVYGKTSHRLTSPKKRRPKQVGFATAR
jgi:hypothetical protein